MIIEKPKQKNELERTKIATKETKRMSSSASLKRKRKDTENKISFSKKYQVGLPCEKKLRQCVNDTLSFLIRIRPLALKYDFGSLCNQLMRCSTSISANLCEGRGRATYPSLINFVSFSRGSLFETFDHLESISTILQTLLDVEEEKNRNIKNLLDSRLMELQDINQLWDQVAKDFQNDWDALLSDSRTHLQNDMENDDTLTIHISEK